MLVRSEPRGSCVVRLGNNFLSEGREEPMAEKGRSPIHGPLARYHCSSVPSLARWLPGFSHTPSHAQAGRQAGRQAGKKAGQLPSLPFPFLPCMGSAAGEAHPVSMPPPGCQQMSKRNQQQQQTMMMG